MKEETNQKGKIEGKTDRERNEIKRKGEGGKDNHLKNRGYFEPKTALALNRPLL